MPSASTAGCRVFEAVEDGGSCSSNTITKNSLDLSLDLCTVRSGTKDIVLLYVEPPGTVPSLSLNIRCSEFKLKSANDLCPIP